MADQVTQRMTVGAPPARCYETAVDFDCYPQWARDIKAASVLERDDEGRPATVAFRAAAMGRSTSYTLRYDHSRSPEWLSWHLVEGDIVRRLDGAYHFEPVEGDPELTEVTYQLSVELLVPLPGFVKRRAEERITHFALKELKAQVELQPRA